MADTFFTDNLFKSQYPCSLRGIVIAIGCILFCFVLPACNAANSPAEASDSSAVSITTTVSEDRTEVKQTPVATYHYAIPNDLNKWAFDVSLKETNKRFNYLMEMQYQEMTGSDTISFPNFGFEPQPVIQKGKTNLECIIGFLDKEKKFREYIKVFVENDRLRVKTLKQYAVYQQ